MDKTPISKAEQFAANFVNSIAIYRAIEEAKQNPDEAKLIEDIIVHLAQLSNPAEA